MASEKVKNKETKVPTTCELNDRDYLLDVLETIKNMNSNMAIALNEASNNKLYKEFLEITDEISFAQRELYELAFYKGWYVIEEAKETKINEKRTNLEKKLTELQQ